MRKDKTPPTFMFFKEEDITILYDLKQFKLTVYIGLGIILLCGIAWFF
jgi:hypothetical protein